MEYRRSLIASAMTLPLMVGGCGGSSSSESGDGAIGVSPAPAPVVIAGSIGIEANTRVDGDTADRLILSRSPLTEPQPLPASFVLAGYVSREEDSRGTSDPFDDFPKDPEDSFRVALVPGDGLSLRTFFDDAGGPPITLKLQRLDETGVGSQTTDPASQVYSARVSLPTGEAPGDYLVVVTTDPSDPRPARYVLEKTTGTQSAVLNLDWPEHAFVPGRAIVAMKDLAGQRMAATSQSGGKVIRALDEEHWLMAMPATRMSTPSTDGQDTLDWIGTLRQQPGIANAVPDYIVSAQGPLDEPLYPKQWHYDLINLPAAWQLATDGGVGVKVAVLDTGLFKDSAGWHPDLAANVVSPIPVGADFVSAEFDNDIPPGRGRDNDPRDPGNAAGNNVFHGTHVAGTVAASATNQLGGTGAAFGSKLLPVRVLGEGGIGSSADLIDAIRWVGGSIPVKADVINLSLGGLPQITALQNAISDAVTNGVIIVGAAGNQSSSVPAYPAAAQGVFSVSAVDGGGRLASYSNFGSWIDLAAPGGDIRRDANLDGLADLVISASGSPSDGGFEPDYAGLQGTSMAAPHVAGVFALMKSVRPSLDTDTLVTWLADGRLTSPVPGGRSDALGYGVIDAAKAVLTAIDNPSVTILSASPTIVSLSSETSPSQDVVLQVLGDQSRSPVIDPVASPDWLDVSLSETQPFVITVSLDEQTLTPGIPVRTKLEVNYTTDSARVLEIPVVAELVTDENARDAGRHFVLLVNTEPNAQGQLEAAAQDSMVAVNGAYQFNFRLADGQGSVFSGAPLGDYYLVAGTDLDNDGIICQAGEACAEYPVTGLREVITIDENTDLTGIRMTTSYSRPTISAATPDVLPRSGFSGYKLKAPQPTSAAAPKTIGAVR